MVEKITIGDRKLVCITDSITLSFPKYGYIDGLTRYSEYIKTGENIPFTDIEYGDTYNVKISFKGDLQIGFGKPNLVNFIKRHYSRIDPKIFNKITIDPIRLTDDEFEKFFRGDKFKIFVDLSNKKIFFKLEKKNIISEKIEENIDNKKLIDYIGSVFNNAKEKADLKTSIDKISGENEEEEIKKIKELSEKTDFKGYVDILYERIRQTDYMYRKSYITNLINSLMTQQIVDLRGVSGIGKDSIAKIFATLSGEDYNYQVLEISASIGLEVDDKRVLGYQHALTNEYQYSKYLIHIMKANKDRKKPFFIIITEANLVNLDKSFTPITSSVDSAFKKITLPRYGNIENATESDPEFSDNIFIFLTTNETKERKDLSLKDKDRIMIIDNNVPYLRRKKDRSGEKYKPLSPEYILAELFKKHILDNKFRTMTIEEALYKNEDYKIWEDKYNDVIADLYDTLNSTLREEHMEQLQLTNRIQNATNKYLFVARLLPIDEKFYNEEKYKDLTIDQKLELNQKLAFDRFLSQKFITKFEDATDINLNCLKKIKEILSKEAKSDISLLPKDAGCIKMLENIIWRIEIYGKQNDSGLGFFDQSED